MSEYDECCAVDAWIALKVRAMATGEIYDTESKTWFKPAPWLLSKTEDSTTPAKSQEATIESAARTTIDALIGGRVGRQTREDLGDALKRATRDSGVGNAIIGRRAP